MRAFVQGVEAAGLETHGFMLARGGRLVAQGWWDPYTPVLPHLLYSLSKTFTGTAWAFAEQEGLVERDRPLIEYWPELADVPGPRARRWTARMLLRMASGHTSETFAGPDSTEFQVGDGRVDGVAWCFANEPDGEPGSVFCYNQLCTYLVAATVQRVAGERLTDFLRPRLFAPLGIDVAVWQADNSGRQLGFTGLHIRLESVLKLGLFYRAKGVWQGRRLLPQAWFDEAARPLSDTSGPDSNGGPRSPDWAAGYGNQVWMATHGYRGDGAFGQFMIVLPELDAVLAINSGEDDMQAVLDQVWAHLLPALEEAGEEGDGDPLTVTGLALPVLGGSGPDSSFVLAEPSYDSNWGPIPAPVTGFAVRRDGACWLLDVEIGGRTFAVPAGDGAWAASELPGRDGPVAVRASAGWDDGTFRARLVLVTTPHSILLEGHDGRFTSRWSYPPLRGRSILDVGLPS